MKLLIELDEEYVKAIDKIRFLVGGRTDRKLQLEIIKAIKNGKALVQEPKTGHLLMPDKMYSSKIWRKCSCCGTHIEKYSKYISFDGEVHYIPCRLNYCCICGTKFVESQESEDKE